MSKYKDEYGAKVQKEVPCDQRHTSIAEAIMHAERTLQFVGRSDVKPYFGTMRFTEGIVVGYQLEKRRWRLDYDESKKVHVNEEDFSNGTRKVVHLIPGASLQMAECYWRKWTSRYGRYGTAKPPGTE